MQGSSDDQLGVETLSYPRFRRRFFVTLSYLLFTRMVVAFCECGFKIKTHLERYAGRTI